MPVATCRDIQINYETKGSGPRLLYIGGTGGDLRVRPNVFDGKLPENFEVLSYDQRGLGQSGKPDHPYAMADYADDAAALLDAVGWADAMVMGVSFGGMVALNLIARHRAKVTRLVLACTSSGGAGGSSYPLHELIGLPPKEAAAIRIGVVDNRRDTAWQKANSQILADEAAAMAKTRTGIPSDTESRMGARRQLLARAEHDCWEALPAIDVPTYICGGKYDDQAPVANQQALEGAISGSSMELFDGGHGFLRQDPQAIESIIAFLSNP